VTDVLDGPTESPGSGGLLVPSVDDAPEGQAVGWRHRHLLDVDELSTEDIDLVMRTADAMREVLARPISKVPALRGWNVTILFYEASTRTRVSFEVAAKNLSADVTNIAAADLGAPAAKKYDIEVWLPGQGRYRELTSCSNCTDYQARRLEARYRPEGGSPRVLHTLNGTAVTSSRSVIAVLETHQQEDGSVAVPEVLQRQGAPARIAPRGR